MGENIHQKKKIKKNGRNKGEVEDVREGGRGT